MLALDQPRPPLGPVPLVMRTFMHWRSESDIVAAGVATGILEPTGRYESGARVAEAAVPAGAGGSMAHGARGPQQARRANGIVTSKGEHSRRNCLPCRSRHGASSLQPLQRRA